MAYAKLDFDVSLNSLEDEKDNTRDSLNSYMERRLRTHHSSKKSESLFTRRANKPTGIKDSLLLYDDQSFEAKGPSAVEVPRRRLSGARDYYEEGNENLRPNNFAQGKHAWYQSATERTEAGCSEHSQSERPTTTNSLRIKHVLANAARSIAESQQACMGIKERLNKYHIRGPGPIPGSFLSDPAAPGQLDPETSFDATPNVSDSTGLAYSEPIDYLPQILLFPVLTKATFVVLAHCAASEATDYTFTGASLRIVDAGTSGLSLPQVDGLILQFTEAWLMVKVLPPLVKAPWRFYHIAYRYRDCCEIGRDVRELHNAAVFQELVALCKRHELVSSNAYRISLAILLLAPLVLTLGLLFGHQITWQLSSSVTSSTISSPVYSSFMMVAFSPSQMVMAIWCLWCQYSKDAFQHLESYILGQHRSFVEDTEFIADQIEQTRNVNGEDFDAAGTGQSAVTKHIQDISKTKDFGSCPEATQMLDSPTSAIQLPTFAEAAFESPLLRKEHENGNKLVIRPIPFSENQSSSDRLPSPAPVSYLNRIAQIPRYIILLYSYLLSLALKIVFYLCILAISVVIGTRKSIPTSNESKSVT